MHLSFFNDRATTDIYTLSLHDALPISSRHSADSQVIPLSCSIGEVRSTSIHFQLTDSLIFMQASLNGSQPLRSEEHTSELQSLRHLVCRLLLEKKPTRFNTSTKLDDRR